MCVSPFVRNKKKSFPSSIHISNTHKKYFRDENYSVENFIRIIKISRNKSLLKELKKCHVVSNKRETYYILHAT